MKPFLTLAETKTPDDGRLSLHERDGDYFVYLNGQQLMSSKATVSEIRLAELACAKFKKGLAHKILIGGLGLGFTLKRTLQLIGQDARVQVDELIPDIVEWNKTHLTSLNGSLLDDPRVDVKVRDVGATIRSSKPDYYEAIMLDVDNGPQAFVSRGNRQLYSRDGLRAIARAIQIGGRAVFWSASKDPIFHKRLKNNGWKTTVVPSKAYQEAKKETHVLYQAERTERTRIDFDFDD